MGSVSARQRTAKLRGRWLCRTTSSHAVLGHNGPAHTIPDCAMPYCAGPAIPAHAGLYWADSPCHLTSRRGGDWGREGCPRSGKLCFRQGTYGAAWPFLSCRQVRLAGTTLLLPLLLFALPLVIKYSFPRFPSLLISPS